MISEQDFITAISESFIPGQKLGSGKDGEVMEYTNKFNGTKYAFKCITLSDSIRNSADEIDKINEEIEFYRKQTTKFILNPHPNIVRISYFFVSDDKTKFYIFMEKMKCTLTSSIKERIKNNYNFFTLKEYRDLITSLIKTFSYLENLKIAHRDIKPDNLMFSEERIIKIVDLGESDLGKDYKETLSIEIQGTVPYLAPELKYMYEENLLKSKTATNVYKCDVFSLGIVFLQVGCLKKQAEIKGLNCKNEENQKKVRDLLVELNDRYGKPYKVLIEKMLKINSVERPTFNELEQLIPSLCDFKEDEGIDEEEKKIEELDNVKIKIKYNIYFIIRRKISYVVLFRMKLKIWRIPNFIH